MSTPIRRRALAMGLAGALMITAAVPTWAAAVPSNTTGVKAAVASDVIDVRWRGRYGGAVIGGVAAGLALGAIAGAAARPYYYDPGYAYYGYAQPYYAPPSVYAPPQVYYPPEPVYAAPPPPRGGAYRQCWVQNDERGFGYWRPC